MSADDRFEDAVEWAHAHVRRGMVDAPSQTAQQHALSMLTQPTFEDDIAAQIEFARRPWHFEVIVNTAAECLRAGKPMPASLAEFAADVLAGTRRRPKGRSRGSEWRPEPMALGLLVRMVHNRFDLNLYSDSDPDALTAARAVEKALARGRYPRSHSTVVDGYKALAKATKTSG